MRRLVAAALLSASACGKADETPSARMDSLPAARPPLAYLTALAGQYPADARLWETEPLRTRMTRLLGGDYEAFLRNMKTSGPVSVENGLIYVTGNCPSSEKTWGAGVLVADPAGDRLLLNMYSQQWDSIRSYADGEIPSLPADVMTTLGAWTERSKATKARVTAGRKPPTEGG
jgi:hypothetical protein